MGRLQISLSNFERKKLGEAVVAELRRTEPKEATKFDIFKFLIAGWNVGRNLVLTMVAIAIFCGVLLTLYKSVAAPSMVILPISVPDTLAKIGYSPEAISSKLKAEIQALGNETGNVIPRSRTANRLLDIFTSQEQLAISVPTTGISIDIVADQIRSLLHTSNNWAVSGMIVEQEGFYDLYLAMKDNNRGYHTVQIADRDIKALLRTAARQIWEAADPVSASYAYLNTDPAMAFSLACRVRQQSRRGSVDEVWANVLESAVALSLDRFDQTAIAARRVIYSSVADDTAKAVGYYHLGAAFYNQDEKNGVISRDLVNLALAEYTNSLGSNRYYEYAYVGMGQAFLDLYLLEKKEKHEDPAQEAFANAISNFQKAIELDPEDVKARVSLAYAFRSRGYYQRAAEEYRRSIELDPRFAYPHSDLAQMAAEQHKFDRAEREYGRAIRLDPANADLHYELADTLRNLGHPILAIEQFQVSADLRRRKSAIPKTCKDL